MDQDYINNLSQEDKEYLSQFNNEYYGNTLNKDWRKNLHLKQDKKAIYDQTNARNRDMFNQRYKYNENESGIPIPEHFSEYSNPEDAYIDYIYIKKKMLKFMEEARASGMDEKEVIELTAKIFDIE